MSQKFKGSISETSLSDYYASKYAEMLCETELKFRNNPPKFNEELSIRHHRMTIALAMPDKVRK